MFRVDGAIACCVHFAMCGLLLAGPTDAVITPVGVIGSADTVSSFEFPFGHVDNLINGDTDLAMTNNGIVEDGTANPEVPAIVMTEEDALSFDHRNIFTGEDPGLAAWHWITAPRNGDDFSDFFDPNLNDDPITLEFDLGGSFEVGGMFVWRYNGGFGSLEQNNPKDWTIEFSTDGGSTYGNQETIPTLTNTGLGGNSVGGELLSFPAHEADFVKVTITDNFEGQPGLAFGGDRVGLAEVRFQGLELAGNNADYNGNGIVDAADYTIWLANLGANGSPGSISGDGTSTGDLLGTPDGLVDQWDYDYWRQEFGNSDASGSGATTGAIPEPASALLLLSVLAGALGCRSRLGVHSACVSGSLE